MSGHHPPLTCDEFKAVLKALGFVERLRRTGTTHESWVATIDGVFRKVTVDCPKAPFSQDLITSMANQAGVTKKQIYDVHFGHVAAAQQQATVVTKRFEAHKQDKTGIEEYWCVWDTQSNVPAFGGSLRYMTETDAVAKAEQLCNSASANKCA
jgi:hypothetical protein